MSLTRKQIVEKRDQKVRPTMQALAPIWMVNDQFHPREEALLFNLIYLHPHHGWISERYKYDAFNDVLYHMGQRRLSEEESLKVQDQEPYILGEVTARVPNDPTGRAKIAM